MKEYKRSLTLYLVIILLMLLSFNFVLFVLSPANQLSNAQAKIMEKLFKRYDIERCQTIQRYQYSRLMYVSNCRIKEVDTFIFFDKNGITHHRLKVDPIKIREDVERLIKVIDDTKTTMTVIYDEGKVLYRFQSKTMEWLFDYNDLTLVKKVRLTYV